MNREIVLKSKQVVEAFCGGESLGTFEITSEWNGMAKLESRDATLIVHREGGAAIGALLGFDEKVSVLKGSPHVLSKIEQVNATRSNPLNSAPSTPAGVGKWRYTMPGEKPVECVVFWADQGFCAVYIDGKKQLPVRELKDAVWERLP